ACCCGLPPQHRPRQINAGPDLSTARPSTMPGPRHADREPAGVPCATLINHILGSQKENDMKITKNRLETTPGPSDWFTGAVYIDTVAAPSNGSRLSASSVHFTPGARTAWHTHPNGQTI